MRKLLTAIGVFCIIIVLGGAVIMACVQLDNAILAMFAGG